MKQPIVVSFGGGVNSAAMLVGMKQRNMRPDAILFADTGGEKPHTYDFIASLQPVLEKWEFPPITTVSYGDNYRYKTLYDNCIGEKMLPSLAYGYKSCSQKWKRSPQERWAKSWQPAIDWWASGGKIKKAIGYDLSETHRAKIPNDAQYEYWYPLVEWKWDRKDCDAAIKSYGLTNPGKSSCFFCPASKKKEILDLQKNYPNLLQQALDMEKNAVTTHVVGLGRNWSWTAFINQENHQGKLFPELNDMPCDCYDGENES